MDRKTLLLWFSSPWFWAPFATYMAVFAAALAIEHLFPLPALLS